MTGRKQEDFAVSGEVNGRVIWETGWRVVPFPEKGVKPRTAGFRTR